MILKLLAIAALALTLYAILGATRPRNGFPPPPKLITNQSPEEFVDVYLDSVEYKDGVMTLLVNSSAKLTVTPVREQGKFKKDRLEIVGPSDKYRSPPQEVKIPDIPAYSEFWLGDRHLTLSFVPDGEVKGKFHVTQEVTLYSFGKGATRWEGTIQFGPDKTKIEFPASRKWIEDAKAKSSR